MDWISLLKAQQADFIQRMKKPKTYEVSLLESQARGCHAEIIPIFRDPLEKMIEFVLEQAEIVAQNPPPIPSEYPDDPEWGIPFQEYYQRQAEEYLLRELIVERVMLERFGKQVKKVPVSAYGNIVLDEEGNLRGENKFPYSLADTPDIKLLVYAIDGESWNGIKKDRVRWAITQEDIKNHQVLLFLCLFSPFSTPERGYEKPAVVSGFLPSNQLEFSEPKIFVAFSDLLYAGGVNWYLESLSSKKNSPLSVDEIIIPETIQTLPLGHPLATIVGEWECWQTLRGHTRGINCLAFNHGATSNNLPPLLASGSRGESKLWDLTKGECVATFLEHPWVPSGQVDEVNSLVFSPDGQNLVSGGADSTVKIWHVGARDVIDILRKHNGMIRCVAFTPDGRSLASGGDDRRILFWDLMQRQVVNALSLDDTAAHSVIFSPDGLLLVTGSYRKIKIWRYPEARLLHTLTGHTHIVRSLFISRDGKLLISGSRDKTIKIWHLQTGELIRTLKGHRDGVYSIALSPDGQTIASGSADKTVKIWHLETGELLGTFSGHTNIVTAVAFSPSGDILVSGSLDKTIKIWQKDYPFPPF